jgi:prepilin-type processing-associated H-X9-DG protein
MKHQITFRSVLGIAGIVALVALMMAPLLGRLSPQSVPVCMSRKKSVWRAMRAYTQDYDNVAPLSSHRPWKGPWHGDLLIPYGATYTDLRCPDDPNPVYEEIALHSNVGYNWQSFAPMGEDWDLTPAMAMSLYSVRDPRRTLIYLDSIWWRDADGNPEGGGNWVVDPPCRYTTDEDGKRDTFPITFLPGAGTLYWSVGAWNPSDPLAWNVYGGVWPWHARHGEPMAVVVYVDGHVRARTIARIAQGCDVQDGWAGRIYDLEEYEWDIRR